MARWSPLCAAALTITSMSAFGTEIRHIEPETYPLLSAGQADIAKAAQLKRRSGAMPSPILVDQVATVAEDGSLRLGCGNREVRDFRGVTLKQGDDQ